MTEQLFKITLRLDQIPALSDALCYAIESMSEEAEADPEVAEDFRAVMALRDSLQQQLDSQRVEQ